MSFEFSATEVRAYQSGHYEDALALFRYRVDEDPEAMRVLASLIWLCERVLAVVPDDMDMEHFAVQREWNRASSARRVWLRLRGRKPVFVRCKWCGHFSEHHHPNRGTTENRCSRCSAMYPAPSIEWDTPRGMAWASDRSWDRNSVNEQVSKEFFERAEAEGLVVDD